ncbi:hypothetical protein ACJ73_08050 [Blastomyces percursus]|uniref:Uncharacterized protein n=1 Tax=Blastomyces percursus TaxID=1658174 RepID=A0A1J9PXI2_9EURO|nr:hypothetical protein ACJ73_08050 [Blastomyces percursus]
MFLLKCHSLSLAINVVTDPTQTTKGKAAKATRRYHPSQIVPWQGFTDEQAYIWDGLRPITAEMVFRYYEWDTVENQVQMVVNAFYEDEKLKQIFELAGSVTFESHTNLGGSKQNRVVDKETQHLLIDANMSSFQDQGPGKGKQKDSKADAPLSRGQAHRFCVYRRGNKEDVPAIAIEYKAPHKLTCDEIATGLAQGIQPARDVINKEEDTSEFYSKRLATVVVTQLFSYMVAKGVQYGYYARERFLCSFISPKTLRLSNT